MDITLIAILFFVFLAIVFLSLFLFKSINKKSFKANDGSIFENQTDLDVYNSLYEKTKPIFSSPDERPTNQLVLGFETSFLIKVTSEGFNDLKTLIKYRKQIKLLSDLINA